MGLMWTNKKVTVNCKKNYENHRWFTLVDNKYGEAHDFSVSTDVLKYLLDEGFDGVTNYVNELVEKKFEDEKKKRKWRTYHFYVKKCYAAHIINRLDPSEHVKSWEISDDGMFKEDGMVKIEYVADQQLLHQRMGEVVLAI